MKFNHCTKFRDQMSNGSAVGVLTEGHTEYRLLVYERYCLISDILEAAANLSYEVASICSFCSRMKRGRIYHAARREGYNVLAMGQHLDDLAER